MELEFQIRDAEAAVRQGYYHSGGYSSGGHSSGRKLERTAGTEREDVQYPAFDPRRAVGAAHERGNGADDRDASGNGRNDRNRMSGDIQSASEILPGRYDRDEEFDEIPVITGWETERAVLFQDADARRVQAEIRAENAQSNTDITADIGCIIHGIGAVDSLINGEPTEDEPVKYMTESKLLKKEWEKKSALGLKM